MPMLLACPHCQAPLPPPAGGFVTCSYCKATSSIDAQGGGFGAAPIPESPADRQEGPSRGSPEERRKISLATFQRVLSSNGTPEQAAWYAAHDLAIAGIDPGEVTYGAIALAKDFDRENKTTVLRDPQCMARLFEAYAKLAAEVRAKGRGDINMPFFTVGPQGIPLHYSREIDARTLAMLVARPGT
jgi:hypothetical protein